MKKTLVAVMTTLIIVMSIFTCTFASSTDNTNVIAENIGALTDNVERGNASETTLKNLKTKEEKIAYYTEKYGDETEGRVAYWISIVQKYSVPAFFLLLIFGAFNFFIVGNKKLHQKEKGFSVIVGSIIGLIVFQAIPLIYALFVAGR